MHVFESEQMKDKKERGCPGEGSRGDMAPQGMGQFVRGRYFWSISCSQCKTWL